MCLMVADTLEFVPVNKDLRLIGGSGHRLQLAYSESLGLYIGVYLHAPRQGQVMRNFAFGEYKMYFLETKNTVSTIIYNFWLFGKGSLQLYTLFWKLR